MLQQRELTGTNLTVSLEKDGDKFVGCIYIGGEFWDWREFGENEQRALNWYLDPMGEDRTREIRQQEREEAREAEMIPYRAAAYERISRGRRIAPKTGAA